MKLITREDDFRVWCKVAAVFGIVGKNDFKYYSGRYILDFVSPKLFFKVIVV